MRSRGLVLAISVNLSLSGLSRAVWCADNSGIEVRVSSQPATLALAAFLTEGALQTMGHMTVELRGEPEPPKTTTVGEGKSVWALGKGQALAFRFEFPAKFSAERLEVEELGWANPDREVVIALAVNGVNLDPLPGAEAGAVVTHRTALPPRTLRPGTNEIVLTNTHGDMRGIQAVRVSAVTAPVKQWGDAANRRSVALLSPLPGQRLDPRNASCEIAWQTANLPDSATITLQFRNNEGPWTTLAENLPHNHPACTGTAGKYSAWRPDNATDTWEIRLLCHDSGPQDSTIEKQDATKSPGLQTTGGDSAAIEEPVVPVVLTDSERKQGLSEIHKAAAEGNLRALERLISGGAEKNALTGQKWTALHYAAAGGHTAAIEYLLDAGLELNRKTSAMGGGWATPLYLAAKGGHVEAVKVLITRGADLNATAMQSWTALHIAATSGHLIVVSELIAAGADARLQSDQCESPVHWAACEGHTQIVKELIGTGKADKLTINIEGKTALHLAAENGHREVAQYLVDIGVPLNAVDTKGRTAVDLCNPKFVKQYRSVVDVRSHQAVYDFLRSRKGKHGYELVKKQPQKKKK